MIFDLGREGAFFGKETEKWIKQEAFRTMAFCVLSVYAVEATTEAISIISIIVRGGSAVFAAVVVAAARSLSLCCHPFVLGGGFSSLF